MYSGYYDRKWRKLTVSLPLPAINSPVVVAVVVYGTFAIEQQSILAHFDSQSAVRAQEELVAELRMRVRL